ncbi:conserved protein of unknown function [Methylorubrum extorquens]|uniref:Hedgehog/Intein (Hint) domain-containing protein n=1 Tax=Methylorubrum extorquens TaxID=408 RepID=A0A2N9AHF9_METEX|nr:conserved protein of unknown function [Methylorubrum extorquens]
MANVYNYTFNGTVNLAQQSQGSNYPRFAEVSGNFTVDYDRQYANGTAIPGDIFVNGQRVSGPSIFQTQNSSGVITYDIFANRFQSLEGPRQSVNLYYNGQAPTSFVNVQLLTTNADNSVFPARNEDAIYRSQQIAVTSTPVCFTTGTLIRTARGEVAVEDLIVGDLAVTASGLLRPITWIGNRTLGAKGDALPHNEQPIRIRAGAFGPRLPARDLRLSHGHPVLIGDDANGEGGVLVPVMCLINGTTITREPVASVTYWHVELDSHDILLAEDLPAESYIDGGDRSFFTEASDHALHNPDFVPTAWDARCRPVVVDGPLVDAERMRLDAVFAGLLSEQCGWGEVVVGYA